MARERVDLERLPDRVRVRAWVRGAAGEVGYGRFGRYGWYAYRAGRRVVRAWIVGDERAACALVQQWIGGDSGWREIPVATVDRIDEAPVQHL